MKQNYEFCIKEVLKSEGGYTNDPADSGGETNFGITQRETSIDVKTMNVDQAKAIYKKKYWDAVDADNLPSGVDYTVFDYAVNSGVARAKKIYNQFKDEKDAAVVITKINNERQNFLNNLAVRRPKDQKFIKGWTARVNRVRTDSLRLAKPRDNVTGPVGGVVAAGATTLSLQDYFILHPYVATGVAIAIGLGIWGLIHWYRNHDATMVK